MYRLGTIRRAIHCTKPGRLILALAEVCHITFNESLPLSRPLDIKSEEKGVELKEKAGFRSVALKWGDGHVVS